MQIVPRLQTTKVQKMIKKYKIKSTFGDLNLDDQINILDIVQLVSYILENDYIQNGDINSDQIINVLDVIQLINVILG